MKKSIIISIKPEWVEKILNGEKTIEIRKSIPKCALPIDVYIYCTKGKNNLRKISCYHTKTKIRTFNYRIINLDYNTNEIVNGKIVAKFTLNKVDKYQVYDDFCKHGRWLKNDMIFADNEEIEEFFEKSCLTNDDLEKYIDITDFSYYQENVKQKHNIFYALHIDNLEIFDKPIELSEFYKGNYEQIIDHLQTVGCDSVYCPYLKDDGCYIMYCPNLKIKKAPQSWCYAYKEEN